MSRGREGRVCCQGSTQADVSPGLLDGRRQAAPAEDLAGWVRVGRAGLGVDAAHREGFSGFRRAVRAWGLVPAAVNERTAADGLLAGAARGPAAGSGRPRQDLGGGPPRPRHAGRHHPGPRRAPALAPRGAPPHRPAAPPHRDDHRRTHRWSGALATRGQDAVGAAHPDGGHPPRAHPAAPDAHLTDDPPSRA